MASEQPSEFTLEREKLDLEVPQESALAMQIIRLQEAFDSEGLSETHDDYKRRNQRDASG